jgi:hypothetical protein
LAAVVAALVIVGSAGYFIARGGSDTASTATTTTDATPSTPDSSAPPTTEPQLETPTTCFMQGSAALQPGIPFGEQRSQTVSLPADLDCSTDQGQLGGTATFSVDFPVLGFNGGTGTGSGSIAWDDGRSTEVVLTAEVVGIPELQLVLQLDAIGGVGEGQTAFATSALTVDVEPSEVLNSIGIAGNMEWSVPVDATTTTAPPPAG